MVAASLPTYLTGAGDMMTRSLTILGSTGVIGTLTLDVITHLSGQFNVLALSAGRNVERLAEQVRAFKPAYVSVADEDARKRLVALLDGCEHMPDIGFGEAGLEQAAEVPSDVVVTAVVGAVGLVPTWKAIQRGATIALANKETLVAGGDFIMSHAARHAVSIIPLDSEHSAIYQCLQGAAGSVVSRFLVTASGGPFRTTPFAKLSRVTKDEALNHPTWTMGRKITVDSATLMNKGLEVIEAHHLFQASYDSIEVVVHAESVIHSMVEFVDGSIIAQLGHADMRVPIQYALTYPTHQARDGMRLNFAELARLTFETPDLERFPSLRLAFEAGRAGGYAPCVLNAANELAVNAFLQDRIHFPEIAAVVERTLERVGAGTPQSILDIVQMDRQARLVAAEVLHESR